MESGYGIVIIGSWIVFLIVWGVSSLNVKRDVRGGWPRWFWLARVILLLVVLVLIARGGSEWWHAVVLWSAASPVLGWIAAALTVLGIAFAIWARVHLGRNWTSHPAIKENHELVTSGPYAYVRHPIYTGVLLALLGSAFTGILMVIVFVLFAGLFVRRVFIEERYMIEVFPNDYPAYRARTKRLIPFIW